MRLDAVEVLLPLKERRLRSHRLLVPRDDDAAAQDVWPLAPWLLCRGKGTRECRTETRVDRLGVWHVSVCETCEEKAVVAGTAAEVVTRLDAWVPDWRTTHGE